MKSLKYFIFLNIVGILYSVTNAIFIKKEDNNYLIYVNNTYGMLYDSQIYQKQQEVQQYVAIVMNEIQNIIEDNMETYLNLEALEDFKEKNLPLQERNNYSNAKYVYQISSLDDITVLSSYFSEEINEKVNSIPGIISSELCKGFKVFSSNKKRIQENENKEKREFLEERNINDMINEIKLETGWKDVEVYEDAPLHLSLLSQGYFNGTTTQYDTNYYYPKSAGKDIDIYIIDTSFDFRTSEYSNRNERVTKCLGYILNGNLEKPQSEDYCENTMDHGKIVSMSAGGVKNGAARKANIYGIAFVLDAEDGYDISDQNYLLSLDYILNNIPMRPHKTVINLSVGTLNSFKDSMFLNYITKIFNKFEEKGVIIVTAAGNFNTTISNEIHDEIFIPCALDNVICVGAIDNAGYNNPKAIYDKTSNRMQPVNYIKADFSNYGREMDIYAPSYVIFNSESIDGKWEENELYMDRGTSYSSPIVAGVVATILSDHPEISFNTHSMITYLTEHGQKGIIDDIPEGPNVFINNGKQSVYLKNRDEADSTPFENN